MSKKKSSKLGLLALAVFFLYFAYVFVDQQKIIYNKEIEMQNIQEKISEESKQGEELKKQKEMLNSDEYIEKVAREKLGMVKEKERVFVDVNK